jgi:hypothetical protein
MPDWVILVDSPKDFPNADTPHKVISTRDYLARANLFRGARPKIINLSRSFAYQSRGYYCSLLAEARGHGIIPSVETVVDLGTRQLYAQSLPELEDALIKALAGAEDKTAPARILACFGRVEDRRFDRFALLLFDCIAVRCLKSSSKMERGRRFGAWLPCRLLGCQPRSCVSFTPLFTTIRPASGAVARPARPRAIHLRSSTIPTRRCRRRRCRP